MSIYSKLSEARSKFHALKLSKTGHNKFAGYYYFELGDFIIPALSVFRECGIVSVISFDKETAYMSLIDIDKPDDRIVITSPMSSAALKGAHEIQNLGAVQTYLRRYLWVAAMEIVEHDAIDSSKPMEKTKIIHTPTGAPVIEINRMSIIADVAESIKSHFDSDDLYGAYEDYSCIVDEEEKVQLWKLLPSNIRSSLKKYGQNIVLETLTTN